MSEQSSGLIGGAGQPGMNAPVDVLAVLQRIAKEAEVALLDGAGIGEGDPVPQDLAEKIVGIWKGCDSARAAIAELIEADKALREAVGTCERWFTKHSPTAPLIGGQGEAEHPMLTMLRAVGGVK